MPLILVAIGGWVWFAPQIKAAFAGGIPKVGSKPRDEFLATVDSARDLIRHFEGNGDEEGEQAARVAAARLFTEPKPK